MLYLTPHGEFQTIGYPCFHCKKACFLLMPSDTPCWMKRAYKREYEGLLMMATCKEGQEAERIKTGFNFNYLLSYLAHQPKKFQDMTKTCIVDITGIEDMLISKNLNPKGIDIATLKSDLDEIEKGDL